jgi:FlaA1/EpsC-like NDP-sugar epimerase
VNRLRRLALPFGDLVAVFAANLVAAALRFEFDWSQMANRDHHVFAITLLDLCVTPVIFRLCGLYRGYWKYTGLDDLIRLARAVAFRSVTLVVLIYGGISGVSRAILILASLLLLAFAGGMRLLPRFTHEVRGSRRRIGGRRTLIIGAGDTGESLLRELRKGSEGDFNAIGFLDDDPAKSRATIHGVPVVGTGADLKQRIEELGIRDVILAVPRASRPWMLEIFETCRAAGVRLRTVPTLGELQRGAARIGQIRMVEIEDLLGREVVRLDLQHLREGLRGRRVLVTGAAGSIGRELARQVAAHDPAELIVLDRNENNLFYLDADLRQAHPLLRFRAVVGDVLDRGRMTALLEAARPEIVLHAAAYKHVPLMEDHPLEAIKNNVLATRRLAEASVAAGVERFIYISTDKAVRPTSVMGATKRLGERLVKSLSGDRTRFMAVRFGNVLGSDGSVIPTFRRQIAAGGPVTVTHPEATRYFMTIPEAVQLVLTAGIMGEGGEIFLLRMGEPVRIVDLARQLIELSGLRPDADIRITFTGLRPGEKLHEEVHSEAEHALATSNEKILILSGIERLADAEAAPLAALEAAVERGDSAGALQALRALVPEYVPARAGAGEESEESRIVPLVGKRRIDAQN